MGQIVFVSMVWINQKMILEEFNKMFKAVWDKHEDVPETMDFFQSAVSFEIMIHNIHKYDIFSSIVVVIMALTTTSNKPIGSPAAIKISWLTWNVTSNMPIPKDVRRPFRRSGNITLT